MSASGQLQPKPRAPRRVRITRRKRTLAEAAGRSLQCHKRTFRSFDDLVGTKDQRLGELEVDGLRGLGIENEFEFGRLLDGQIGWPCTLEDFVYVEGKAGEGFPQVRTVAQKPAGFDERFPTKHRGQVCVFGEGGDGLPVENQKRVGKCQQSVTIAARNLAERTLEIRRRLAR